MFKSQTFEQELQELKIKHQDLLNFIDSVRDMARNRHPGGVTLLDFLSVWNEQYEKQIALLKIEVVNILTPILSGYATQTELEACKRLVKRCKT